VGLLNSLHERGRLVAEEERKARAAHAEKVQDLLRVTERDDP
jgi:hypothetical protein